MSDYNKLYQKWLKLVDNKELLSELEAIASDEKEKENRFYKELEFGTGGLRGIIGAGTNCINIYTIRKATQGLCDFLGSGKTVAISYDSRINSQLFAQTAAEVFAANGIKAYISKELMPTPFLSFAVRSLKADAGVMVTASHNPSKYNGYKVYGNDGGQMTDNFADGVLEKIKNVDEFEVKTKSFEDYLKDKSVEIMEDSITKEFLQSAYDCGVTDFSDIKICFTPLNGTGYKLVPQILEKKGIKNIVTVSEQSMPDGNFTTCPYPNPEKEEALKLGLIAAVENNCDILLATDPDADRVGVAVNDNGQMTRLSGNETGILLADYLLKIKKQKGTLPKNPLIIKTIVTTSLINKIAEEYNAEVADVLTGFKYIGEQIGLLEKKKEEKRFILGFEESYGYLAGSYVRDKDAVGACLLIAEMAAYYKNSNMTLTKVLDNIYRKYGKFEHKLISKEYPGASGSAKKAELLSKVRQFNLTDISGIKIIKTTDYLTQTERELPKADVLVYDLEKGAQLIIRPSGTEPLIKFYMTAALDEQHNKEIFNKLESFTSQFFG